MNIVYASDDNFAEIMGVSILSLFENNKDVDEIIVYVLDDGIKECNKINLKQIGDEYNRNICFIPLKNLKSKLDNLSQQRGSISTFSRLYLASLLPKDCNKVLYLDCDTIVRHSLNSLYATDFEENVVCGVMDCISKQHRIRVGLPDNALYINAGMMLVDLHAWRDKLIEKNIETVIRKFGGRVPYADQGIINLALQGAIKNVHPRYNCISVYTAFSFNDLLEYRQPSACLSSIEIEEARKDPTIMHFVTLFCMSRPWYKNAIGPYFDEWRHYKSISPWKDFPERIQKKGKIQKIGIIFYRMVPRSISLTILGFLHARVKPLIMR